MAKRIWKVLHCVVLSAFVLVTSNGATRASNVPADAPTQDDCSDWEDWDNTRFWGLWTDEYHIPSSPDFNPHEESRWWNPVRLLFAKGDRHSLMEQYTEEHGHELCDWA